MQLSQMNGKKLRLKCKWKPESLQVAAQGFKSACQTWLWSESVKTTAGRDRQLIREIFDEIRQVRTIVQAVKEQMG